MAHMLSVRYFAKVREAIGMDAELVPNLDDTHTISDILDLLEARGAPYQAVLQERAKLRFALDQMMVNETTNLQGAQELAIFPPVTGG